MESLGHISQPKPSLGQEGRKRQEKKKKKEEEEEKHQSIA
jgi:hypothetical protein